ncbi:MAG: FAD-dependent monooxygenase [Pseudomonadota bacterium]
MNDEPIVVVGAGIAGLALSAFLSRHGRHVIIFERRSEIGIDGAGIQLTANAVSVIDALGLTAELREKAHTPEGLTVHSGFSGRAIVTLPFGAAYEARFGYPYHVIHRADLGSVLLEACRREGVEIQFEAGFKGAHERPDGRLQIDTETGERTTPLLIGADGVRSKVRNLVSEAQPTFSGRTAYRALIPGDAIRDAAELDLSVWLGPHAHLVAYPVDQGRFLNVVAVVQSDPQSITGNGSGQSIHSAFRRFAKLPSALTAGDHDWTSWPLFTIDPKFPWHKGRIAILGDAAHAMVPFLAQGGGAALEDAAVLAAALLKHDQPAAAFAEFETTRRKRVSKIWYEAQKTGARYHWSGPMATARDIGLRAMGGDRLLNRYSWIYEWRAPEISA